VCVCVQVAGGGEAVWVCDGVHSSSAAPTGGQQAWSQWPEVSQCVREDCVATSIATSVVKVPRIISVNLFLGSWL